MPEAKAAAVEQEVEAWERDKRIPEAAFDMFRDLGHVPGPYANNPNRIDDLLIEVYCDYMRTFNKIRTGARATADGFANVVFLYELKAELKRAGL
jgi:hypothetical protein